MATTRSFSTAAPLTAPAPHGPRHRLRAVDRDEVVTVADSERRLPAEDRLCFNGPMTGYQKHTATGRHDLEPFWPSRQDHDFDRVCCRAMNAPAL